MSLADRNHLDFPNKVRELFSFLVDLGFVEIEVLPTLVRYRKDGVEFDVYHGRESYEVGAGISAFGTRYSISEIIRSIDSVRAEKYRNVMAATPDLLFSALAELSSLMMQYGARALSGERECFEELKRNREAWSERYALDVLAGQVRPKAEEAFRDGNYAKAADLYFSIRERLTPAEEKKLAFSESRRKAR